jgi:probable rRNA maturation factor
VIEVELANENWRTRIPDVREVVRQAARAASGNNGRVAILLTDDQTLAELNKRFRGKDQETNVLAFPAPAPAGALGDIAVAFGVCDREATAQGKPLRDHLRHLIIHGVLHLIGHDHQSAKDAEAMEAIEIDLLGALGVPNPYEGAARTNDNVRTG